MKPRRAHRLLQMPDEDPLAGLVNLFDTVMVFAVALLVALMTRFPAGLETDAASTGAAPEVDGEVLEHYSETDAEQSGPGERLGTAYRLENGDVIYVPGD